MIGKTKDVHDILLNPEKTKNASMKALVGGAEGWDSHVMRVVTLGDMGFSPLHSHPWPHINYIVEGKGVIEIDGEVFHVEKGSYAFVDGNKRHQFRNESDKPFVFICIVPKEGHVY